MYLFVADVHYFCYIHYVVKEAIVVNDERQLIRDAEDAVRRIFEELCFKTIQIQRKTLIGGRKLDAIIRGTSGETQFEIVIEVRKRITPQTAMSVCEQMRKIPDDIIPVVFSPVISPRVAEILEQNEVGYVDQAGNCRLRSTRHRLLIDRHGYKSPARPPKGIADLFSPKSSRIVRTMLAQPGKGWQVRELATHPDIEVSVGLAAKVKQTLIEESYAIEHKRQLYLRDSVGLLENWAKYCSEKFIGPADQVTMFFRGNTEEAEQAVAQWCQDNSIRFALAGFSAAWQLAPAVRYSVAAVYVDGNGFEREMLGKLDSFRGGKPVETGANLLLWRPYDSSVFVDSRKDSKTNLPVTSAIQTYLDLRRLGGRGEEAAMAVYEKLLAIPMKEAAQQIEEMCHAKL
ncbi:MAG: type IV toxin-antitoxin system AbiEi family antitoxin [Thermoguttaceae bacterium]|jgi:hypothetical protein